MLVVTHNATVDGCLGFDWQAREGALLSLPLVAAPCPEQVCDQGVLDKGCPSRRGAAPLYNASNLNPLSTERGLYKLSHAYFDATVRAELKVDSATPATHPADHTQ